MDPFISFCLCIFNSDLTVRFTDRRISITITNIAAVTQNQYLKALHWKCQKSKHDCYWTDVDSHALQTNNDFLYPYYEIYHVRELTKPKLFNFEKITQDRSMHTLLNYNGNGCPATAACHIVYFKYWGDIVGLSQGARGIDCYHVTEETHLEEDTDRKPLKIPVLWLLG